MSPSGRPRQVAISEELWDVYALMSDDSGTDAAALINQAMFEMAVRMGYVTPVPMELAAPSADDKPIPAPKPARSSAKQPKFTPGRTREAGGRKPSPGKRPPRPAPRPKKSTSGLYMINEDGNKEKIDKDIFIIGRSSKCDLVINSVKVSREHAIITRERGEFFIEDLGSANGTWYKGERIEKMKIRDGDEFFICDEKFKFITR